MGIAYRLMYAIGFTPWDRVLPDELKRVIEGPDALPKGRALDVDFGCYHGLKSQQRARYAEGVTPLAAPGATLLMMAFTRALPPVPSGVSDSELRDRFGPACGTWPGSNRARRPVRRPLSARRPRGSA